MDERLFQEKLAQLMEKIKSLPTDAQSDLRNVAQQASDRRQRINESVGELQEAVDHLRLSVKYLIFDLEATRRENAYLRKLLDQQQRKRQRRPSDDNFLDENEAGGSD